MPISDLKPHACPLIITPQGCAICGGADCAFFLPDSAMCAIPALGIALISIAAALHHEHPNPTGGHEPCRH